MEPRDAPGHPSRPAPRKAPTGNGRGLVFYQYRGNQPHQPAASRKAKP